jgi:hypothetical protein
MSIKFTRVLLSSSDGTLVDATLKLNVRASIAHIISATLIRFTFCFV